MMADLPHTLYNHKKAEKKVTQEDVDDAEAKMREAYEKRKEQEQRQSFTIEEIFAGAAERE